jgi:dTDP-4-amino-4,6-dideoxygalactose transaminase
MNRITFSDLPAQFNSVRSQTEASWSEIIGKASFIGGEHVAAFERDFAAYTGADFCLGVGNGTDALEIGLLALGLPANSIVLVPANSFVATAEAALNVGLRVRFVDVLDDYSIDIQDLRAKLDSEVSCLAVVHLYGHPAPMGELLELARSAGVLLIEDCAQAHGAAIDGKKVGTFGSFGAFSFYPGKNLGAAGDAGAVVTNDATLHEKMRRIANHGRLSKFDHNLVGRNSRLDALQAALLTQKLRHLDAWNRQRVYNADSYRASLTQSEFLSLPPKIEGSVYHHFVVRTSRRNELKAFLSDNQIETGIHYPIAIPDLQAFQDDAGSSCPNASAMAEELLSLPVAEHLRHSQIEHVANTVNRFFCA